MSLSDFEILSKIGEGTYSTVFKVRRTIDNNFYALKKVNLERLTLKEKKCSLNEIRIIASINHPNVIGYKESFISEEDKALCIIMEYADSGDLLQKIRKCRQRSVRLSETYIWSLLIQMTMGLKALHDLSIFHRDIKSANVFLNKNGTIKLGDMNISKTSKDGFLKTQTGTPYYACPEVWKDSKYDKKSDIWSLGCVLYESIALRLPFNATDMKGLYEKVLQGTYNPLPRGYSEDLTNLIGMMLKNDPSLRPSCEEILSFDCVKNRLNQKKIIKSESSLLDPIRVSNDISLISDSLPFPTYSLSDNHTTKNSISEKLVQFKPNVLPGIKSPKRNSDDIREGVSIFNRNHRVDRIKSIYLSPRNYMSPRERKK